MPVKSPFVEIQELRLNLTTIPSNYKRIPHVHMGDENEMQALRAVAAVGLIQRKVLNELYGLSINHINSMVRSQKLVQHMLQSKALKIPFYTLGENGAGLLGIQNSYKLNYWRMYRTVDILKRLIYIKLFERMVDTGHKIKLIPTMPTSPFIAALEYENGDKVMVYVAKKNIEDLITHYKWASPIEMQTRLLIVAETLNQLETNERYFKNLPMRLVLEQNLFTKYDKNIPLDYYKINDELQFVLDGQ